MIRNRTRLLIWNKKCEKKKCAESVDNLWSGNYPICHKVGSATLIQTSNFKLNCRSDTDLINYVKDNLGGILKLELEQMRSQMLHRKSVCICTVVECMRTCISSGRHEPVTNRDSRRPQFRGVRRTHVGVIRGGTHLHRPILPRQTIVGRWIGSWLASRLIDVGCNKECFSTNSRVWFFLWWRGTFHYVTLVYLHECAFVLFCF